MAGATLAEIINAMMGGDGKGGLSPVTRDIVEDVMPMVESTYKVSKRPDDRAIAGLSMGGGHTHQHRRSAGRSSSATSR